MTPKTADQCLKEFFKTQKRANNKMRILRSRFITGTLSHVSKANLLKELGFKVVQEELWEKK